MSKIFSLSITASVDDDTYPTVMPNKYSKVGAAQRVNLESSKIIKQ